MAATGASATRAFIVDDSALSRAALRKILLRGGIEIVGEAKDGVEALKLIPGKAPDIVLMDINMPNLDGLQTTSELMASFPRPILLVSELVGQDVDLNFKAMQAGALDVARKPSALEIADANAAAGFVRDIKLLAGVPVVTRKRGVATSPSPVGKPVEPATIRTKPIELAVIGASTGGPPALCKILTELGAQFARPVLVVQHMTPGFTPGLVRWLRDATRRNIVCAEAGEAIHAGTVYFANDDRHLVVRNGRFQFDDSPPLQGHRPSVDKLLLSLAESGLASRSAAVLLTGMGKDGAAGLLALKQAGAWTIAQDEASSVVYGMPKAAADLGAACEILDLDRIANRLQALAKIGAMV